LENNSYNTILPYNPDIDKILKFDPILIGYDDNLRDMSNQTKVSSKEYPSWSYPNGGLWHDERFKGASVS